MQTRTLLLTLTVLASGALALSAGCGKTCTVEHDDPETGLDNACYEAGYYAEVNGLEYDPYAVGCEDDEASYEAGWCDGIAEDGLIDPQC